MIKETMDKKFGASWHAVVGEGFGFELTHEGEFYDRAGNLNR
jgi:dynein light chain 4